MNNQPEQLELDIEYWSDEYLAAILTEWCDEKNT
jgi:hypothetical protein